MIEITDGYIGSFGRTFKPATAETLSAAIAAAAAFNSVSPEAIESELECGREVRWCKSPNHYYDHGFGVIRRRPAEPTPKPYTGRRCVVCGAPASMSASLGPACDEHYDDLS